MLRAFTPIFLFLACVACASASERVGAPQASLAPPEAAELFLEAFNAMDRPRFDEHFADDVTMFFPPGPFPADRIESKAAVTAAFHRFFDMVEERGSNRLNIMPTEMVVQDYGEVAIVSFELAGSDSVGRRSIVMRRFGTEWRIVHFHASAIDRPAH